MDAKTQKYRREAPDQRRGELIAAALRVIAKKGPEAATVREISAEAGVAFSLIRHHFSSKEDLLCAAYEHHMRRMIQMSLAEHGGSPRERLAQLVRTTLSPPVSEGGTVRIWAGFIQMVPRDARMKQIHLDSYQAYRRGLEALIRDLLAEHGRAADGAELQRLAIACNAVLDGLWLEGSMLPDLLPADELTHIASRSMLAILGLPSTEAAQ